jgi:hypothetical protein
MRSMRFIVSLSFVVQGAAAWDTLLHEGFSQAATIKPPVQLEASPQTSDVQGELAELAKKVGGLPNGPRRARFQWVQEHLSHMAEKGDRTEELLTLARGLSEALRTGKDASATVPWFDRGRWSGLRMLDNGKIGLAFCATEHGIALQSVFDFATETEFLSKTPTPFWSLTLNANANRKELNSAEGFTRFEVQERLAEPPSTQEVILSMKWLGADGESLQDLSAECVMRIGQKRIACPLAVNNPSATWTITSITLPRVALCQIGDSEEDDFLVVPHGSGELRRSPIGTKASFSGRYPGGWCSMQLFAHYDTKCGFYLATHDPFASTKDFIAKPRDSSSLEIQITWPAPDSGVPGNDWQCPGEAVFESFGGDWFDAAQIYRNWVSKQAGWWPEKGKWGRSDTPRWFEDIAVWALTGGSSEQVVEPVRKFAEYMGVPTAVHWYNWHVIPFDNDYPHYFPYKEGFPRGVKALQEAGVRVMPYINGRLWDTDLEDFKNNAIRSCTKDEKGQPYIEEYGSGAKLSPMCPTTALWQTTVQDTVLRLVGPEVNVDAVYVDQVAAATPCLCYDKTHGHPLAGGDWWTTRGYWPMLESLQNKMSELHPDKALTTECNAEPYVHVFDGYLTWHFQYDNQIPLFAAVYGGKVQLFSRAYQGDSWKGLAMRMKTGQALVFGEQLGWIRPDVISDADSAAFLRRMARLRYALRDYLARGQMARPPALEGDIPMVTADWQWSGKRIVTTPAILSGAWEAEDGRLALIFVNVSDSVQTADLEFDAGQYSLDASPSLTVTPRTENGPEEPTTEERRFRRSIQLKPYDAIAFEISPGS